MILRIGYSCNGFYIFITQLTTCYSCSYQLLETSLPDTEDEILTSSICSLYLQKQRNKNYLKNDTVHI